MHRGGWIVAALCSLLLLAQGAAAAGEASGYKMLTLGGYPVRWLPKDPGGRITLKYRIADREIDQPTAINCKRMRAPETVLRDSGIELAAFRQALAAGFQRWRDIADLTFAEAGPGETADIVIGEQVDPTGFAFTNLELADRPSHGIKAIAGASICLNPARIWKIGYDGNLAVYDLVHTFAHEIGHVIGLDHPVGRASLMSFRYSESLTGLTEGDKRGAISLYGPSRLRSDVVAVPAGSQDAHITTITGRGSESNPGG